MKKILSFVLALSLYSTASFAEIEGMCMNDSGKFSACLIGTSEGVLTLEYKNKKDAILNKKIPGNHITGLTAGEYSRRRIGESIVTGVLLTPLALFGLFSKKKMDQFGVEYLDEKNQKSAVLIQTKKKFGLGLRTGLESISGRTVDYGQNKTNGREDANE